MVHRQNLYYSKIYQKRMYDFLWNWKNLRPSRHLAQLSIRLDDGTSSFRHSDTIKFLKLKWIQRLLNPNNSLWKNIMLYQLNLILNYNQDLVFLDKNRSLGLLVTNIYKNRTIKIFLFNYPMLGYILPITTSLLQPL